MVALRLAASAYRRDDGDLPPLRLVNLYPEKSPASESGFVLLGRPGLVEHYDYGTGPVTGLFYRDGSTSSNILTVSGSTLYDGATSKGEIPGSNIVRWAGNESEVLIAAGATLKRYASGILSDAGVTFGEGCASVMYLDGRFIAIRQGTGQFHYSDVLDGSTWDGLNFYTAESAPDLLIDGIVVNDEAWLFGSESTEVWVGTSNGDDPFTRVEGRNYSKGILNAGAVALFDNTAAWVGNDGIVYRGSSAPIRISDHSIEERIANSSACYLSSYVEGGHSFLHLRTDQGSFFYDAATGEWPEFQSYGRTGFRGQVSCVKDREVYWGDEETGQVWKFDRSVYEDNGEPITGIFSAAAPLNGPQSVDSLRLNVSYGTAGLGVDARVEMRFSRDGGHQWTDWEPASLGAQGEYRTIAEWRALGMFDEPGIMFEFRITDPVLRRVSAVKVNEAGGRRG